MISATKLLECKFALSLHLFSTPSREKVRRISIVADSFTHAFRADITNRGTSFAVLLHQSKLGRFQAYNILGYYEAALRKPDFLGKHGVDDFYSYFYACGLNYRMRHYKKAQKCFEEPRQLCTQLWRGFVS